MDNINIKRLAKSIFSQPLNIFIPMTISIAKKSLSLYIYNIENVE